MKQYALVLLLLALVLFVVARQLRIHSGLPAGRVLYSDTSKWKPLEKPLYDPVNRLSGRPDYLVRQGKAIIPVEVKSGSAPQRPYRSHLFQLAAYCLLVEAGYGVRPSHGIIKYDDRSFKIDYSSELERSLMDILTEMRIAEDKSMVDRSHQQAARCHGCGYAATCEQRL